ncbi:hypothetical protein AVEN_21011-1 [Araneus ventricosus]|uniref:Histone-lysine N-methyltransferase SETMAR n=1 Tax=Araneus ventricosus TaxID=182803 RepID=A0A4Y2D668_ARAVE|nr:hypothetical protein AVEN_21011-1 [Araneus ventricosus]
MGAEGPHARMAISLEIFFFLDDNARPHTARDTKEHIRRLGCQRLDHLAYSPIILPPFSCIEAALLGRQFRSNEEVRWVVKNFLRSLGIDFYQEGFLKLISQYDKCINVRGEYMEK